MTSAVFLLPAIDYSYRYIKNQNGMKYTYRHRDPYGYDVDVDGYGRGYPYDIHIDIVPLWISVLASICKLFGYYVIFLSMRENSYGSVHVEVAKNHRVISTGVYSIVRHPIYAAVLIIRVAEPLALGSAYTLPVLIIPTVL